MKWLPRVMLAALLTPLALSILISFTPSPYLALPGSGEWTVDWYRRLFQSPQWMAALANSLLIATAAALIAVPVALGAARAGLGRTGEAALLAPMVLPPVALAVGMLAMVRQTPLWGTHASLALAHAVIAMPVCYLVLRSALRQLDPRMEPAARGLGATPWMAFRLVTLPLIAPAVVAAFVFALVISLNEVMIALFLATRDTETLPRVIWPNLRFAISPLVAAAATVLFAASVGALSLAAVWWARAAQASPPSRRSRR